jgi:hypothetical protein
LRAADRIEEDGLIRAAHVLTLAALAVALVPATALGAVVDRDADTGIITIVDDVATADTIAVVRSGGFDTVTRNGGGIFSNTGDCDELAADTVRCPQGTSIAVDLGDGDDTFAVNAVTSPMSVAGGNGDDDIATAGGPDVLAGGPGDDRLRGNSSVDEYFGETGDDTIEARDGNAERISCGGDADQATNDFTDILAECERGVDTDGDGFSSAVDCNDTVFAIKPGAPETFDNGIDENCDGRDNPNLDRDGDGFAVPVDCDDGNAAVRPTAVEVRGNPVDENCDRRAAPFAELGAVVTNQWLVTRTHARLLALVVRLAPRGARIVLTCKGRGCPRRSTQRRTVSRNLQRIVLDRRFRRARLRFGTRLTLRITASGTIGRTYTYVVRRGELPTRRTVCRAPGASKGRPC